MPRSAWVMGLVLVTSGCSADAWRGCTSTVVGTSIETTKEVTTGISEGFEDGRRKGASADGANVAFNAQDLAGKGLITVRSVIGTGEDRQTAVVIAVENSTDEILRLVGLEAEVLDVEGFVVRPQGRPPGEFNVPAKAKDKFELIFPVEASRVGKVRIWGQEVPLPTPAPPIPPG